MNHSFPASDELLEAELDERWNFTSFSSEHYHQKEEVRRDVAYSRRRATMLRAKQIPAFLEQINTDGMRATMLLQVGVVCLPFPQFLFVLSLSLQASFFLERGISSSCGDSCYTAEGFASSYV